MAKSVYIHIPFCHSKCKYCSFVSFCDVSNKNDYLSSLMKEIESNYKGEKLKTLYFGGGTPSLLSADEIEKIINAFNIDENSEVTLELNPDDASLVYLKSLKGVGEKTANVVVSIVYNEPAIAVDTHVFRVSNRLGLANANSPEKTQKQLEKLLDINDWSKMHYALVLHGRYVCKAIKPRCEECFLKSECPYKIKK